MSKVDTFQKDQAPGEAGNGTRESVRPGISDRTARFILAIDRFTLNVARHWLLYMSILLGVFVLTPFAAPALMAAGAEVPAKVIYLFYGLLCHQLPERSYFLFGAKVSYSLREIGQVWKYDDIFSLRQFAGTSAMGWKVAWSDRMVSLYGSWWIAGLVYSFARRRLRLLSPVIWFLLGLFPLAVDGLSHSANDLVAGVSGAGFRDTNAWLQLLTGSLLPGSFYAGDALGSFNSLMRLVTGALFGILSVWLLYPIIDWAMHNLEVQTRARLASPRAIQLGISVAGHPFTEKGH